MSNIEGFEDLVAPSPVSSGPVAAAASEQSAFAGFEDLVTPTREAPPQADISGFEDLVGSSGPKAEDASTWQNIGSGYQRGFEDLKTATNLTIPVVMYQMGMGDIGELADSAAPVRASRKKKESGLVQPADPWTLPWFEQSLGGMIPGIATTVLGGVAGGVAGGAAGSVIPVAGSAAGAATGTLAGLAASGAFLENANAFFDYLDYKGVDTSNAEATKAALLLDPELGTEASMYAARRSAVAGVVNAVAGKLGGKIASSAMTPSKKLAADVAIGGASMGVGAAANQAMDGKFDADELLQQFTLGLVSGTPIVAMGGMKVGVRFAKEGLKKIIRTDTTRTPLPVFKFDENGNVTNPEIDFNDPENVAAATIAEKIHPVFLEVLTEDNVEGVSHADVRAATWREKLIKKIPVEIFENTRVGQKFFDVLQDLDGRLGEGEMIAALNVARIFIEEIPTTDANLQPTLRFHSPGIDPVDMKISKTANNNIVIDSTSRLLTNSEWTEFLNYAREQKANTFAWRDNVQVLVKAEADKDIFNPLFGTPEKMNWAQVPFSVAKTGDYWALSKQKVERAESPRESARLVPTNKTLAEQYKPEDLEPVANRLKKILSDLRHHAGISKPIEFIISNNPDRFGSAAGRLNKYELQLNIGMHKSVEHLVDTLAHEFGHIVFFDKLANANGKTLLSILDAYHKWREDLVTKARAGADRFDLQFTRSGILDWLAVRGGRLPQMGRRLMPDDVEKNNYWHSFDEWFAQQVAKWGTSQLKPLSIVDKEFQGLGRKIFRILSRVYRATGVKIEPDTIVRDYLNAMLRDVDSSAFANIWHKIAIQSMTQNQKALERLGAGEVTATVQTASTEDMRGVAIKLLSGTPNERWTRTTPDPTSVDKGGRTDKGKIERNLEGMLAIADKVNRFFEKTLGIHQLAFMNQHIRALGAYKENIQAAEAFKIQIGGVNRALKGVQLFHRVRGEDYKKLQAAWNLYDRMGYLTQKELDQGVERLPTKIELDEIVKDLSPRAKEAFYMMIKDFDEHIDVMANVLREIASRGNDLVAQAKRLEEIDKMVADMRSRPYLPHLRFGEFTVKVVDEDGKTMYFATAETRRERAKIAEELKKLFPEPIFKVHESILAKDAIPLVGIPPNLLRVIGDELKLSTTQRIALNDLQYQYAPAKSFVHRMQKRENIPGYSQDWIRAYADYFLHGANYLARVKHRDALESNIKEVREQADFMPDGEKRMAIHNMMSEHMQDWLDPKPDYWRLKAVAFFVHLGFNIKSAVVNLTQLPVSTFPFLARGFGDTRTFKAMMKAFGTNETYYRRASMEGRDEPTLKMLNALTEFGTLTEALAPELASTAEGQNRVEKYLGNHAQRAASWTMHASAFMFQMTEQMNRRVTAMSAYMLAKEYPTASVVQEAVRTNSEQFASLVNQGFNEYEARAVVTAKYAIEATQGIYARWARPKMFRGRLGTLFMFKSFQQQTLFMLWNYPAARVKSFLVLGFLGGLSGLPFSQDLQDLIKVLAYRIFGKDFDIEREARDFIIDLSDGTIPPDLLIHGVSRKGFGIPALLDLAGNTANLGDIPFPETDISGSVGFGPVSPIPLTPLFGPVTDPNEAIGRAAQHSAGAAYSLGFALYKVLTDPTNQQAWSALVPRALYNLNRAYDALNDNVVNQSGARIVKFDPNDTEHMMETLAMSMGYLPLRLTAQWDRIRAIKEVETYWDLRREGLLRQFTSATLNEDNEDRKLALNAIRQFNKQIPSELKMKRITSDNLKQSLVSRQKSIVAQERGRAIQKSNTGIVKSVNRLYPEADTSVGGDVLASRKLPKALTP